MIRVDIAELLRLDPSAGNVGYWNKTRHVLFRPAGTTTWRERGTVTTNSVGLFANSRTFVRGGTELGSPVRRNAQLPAGNLARGLRRRPLTGRKSLRPARCAVVRQVPLVCCR
ncbi:MAG: hypothetical protein ACRDOY_00040 [Nocardioidaceae bacterium]